MAVYNCYIDRDRSSYFNTQIRDKASNKRVIVKDTRVGSKFGFRVFVLFHSDDKKLAGRDSKNHIELSCKRLNENKSTIYVTTQIKNGHWKIIKNR